MPPRKMNPVAEWWQRQLGIIDNPNRKQDVVDMTDPAFAVQNLLGLISPDQAQARASRGKGQVTTATPVENIRSAPPPNLIDPSVAERLTGDTGNLLAGRSSEPTVNVNPGAHATPQQAPGGPGSSYGLDPAPGSRQVGTPANDDPYGINESYDNYLAMIDDMSGTYANLAESNMGQIADIFGEVSGIAQGGVGPLTDSYDQAQENVGGIYDDLDARLGGIGENLQGIAENAAGSAAGDVATTSAAAIAPFEAASATARANTQGNLQSHSTAGQNYLSNLSSASVEEGKMHASRVQAAAQQRQAEFDIRRMELEMAREEALREVAMDSAGSAAEREAIAAMFGAAGIPIPEGMDMKGAQAYLNLGQDIGMFPESGGDEASKADQLKSQLSPTGTSVLESVMRKAEDSWSPKGGLDPDTGQPFTGDRLQDFMFDALTALDDEIALRRQDKSEHPFVTPEWDMAQEEELIREIIRNQYSRL